MTVSNPAYVASAYHVAVAVVWRVNPGRLPAPREGPRDHGALSIVVPIGLGALGPLIGGVRWYHRVLLDGGRSGPTWALRSSPRCSSAAGILGLWQIDRRSEADRTVLHDVRASATLLVGFARGGAFTVVCSSLGGETLGLVSRPPVFSCRRSLRAAARLNRVPRTAVAGASARPDRHHVRRRHGVLRDMRLEHPGTLRSSASCCNALWDFASPSAPPPPTARPPPLSDGPRRWPTSWPSSRWSWSSGRPDPASP